MAYIVHVDEHPSPSIRLPSSQISDNGKAMLSPQSGGGIKHWPVLGLGKYILARSQTKHDVSVPQRIQFGITQG